MLQETGFASNRWYNLETVLPQERFPILRVWYKAYFPCVFLLKEDNERNCTN